MNKEDLFLLNLNRMIDVRRSLNKLSKKGYLPDYNYTELKCIALIGNMGEANVTRLAEASYMTRGGISKAIKRLLNSGVVESYQKPENKKEIYFILTDMGKNIYKKYEEYTDSLKERDKIVFNGLSEGEKDVVVKFLEKYNEYLEENIAKAEIMIYEDDNL